MPAMQPQQQERKYSLRMRRAPEQHIKGAPEPVAVKTGSRAAAPPAPSRLLRSQLPSNGRGGGGGGSSRKEGEHKLDNGNDDDDEATSDEDNNNNGDLPDDDDNNNDDDDDEEEHEPIIVDGTELPERVLFLRCSKLKRIVAEKTVELNLEKKKLKELVERLTPRVHAVNQHTREKDTVINTKGVNFLLQKKKPKTKKPQDVAFDHCKRFFQEKGQNASESDIKKLVESIFDKKNQNNGGAGGGGASPPSPQAAGHVSVPAQDDDAKAVVAAAPHVGSAPAPAAAASSLARTLGLQSASTTAGTGGTTDAAHNQGLVLPTPQPHVAVGDLPAEHKEGDVVAAGVGDLPADDAAAANNKEEEQEPEYKVELRLEASVKPKAKNNGSTRGGKRRKRSAASLAAAVRRRK